ncbi:hypothetical protein [Nocardia thailandica]|uniref:hypothetical protein n=1 Tax=Nocardia thailandica TaxID=257275 RepID=UPI000308007D|nr:hypothetical protein [Nocardia thailandica]
MTSPRRAALLAGLALAAAVTLAGCANDTSAVDHEVRRIPTPDGGSVLCVIVRDNANSGSTSVDCNWESRTVTTPANVNEDQP